MDEPLSPGQFPSFSSIEAKVILESGTARTFRGITEVSYSSKLTPGVARGTHPSKLGRTQGEHDCEGSMTMYLPYWLEMLDFLTSEGGGYGEIEFDVQCHYAAPRLPMQTDTLKRCRIASVDNNHSAGSADPLTVQLTLDVMDVLHNGKSIISNPL